MAAANYLPDVLETTEAERLATGFIFTEGPLWHPEGYWYFVDLRRNRLHRMRPGQAPELFRETQGANGTTFDLEGRLVICEGEGRRVARIGHDGQLAVIAERWQGGRFNRPNDVVCRSDGSLYFTDPDKRRPYQEREIPGPAGTDNLWDGACVYRLMPDGTLSVLAHCEYPNGLAFSPDERTLYVSDTSAALGREASGNHCIFAFDVVDGQRLVNGRRFAEVSPGVPDGFRVDERGWIYTSAEDGVQVFDASGTLLGRIAVPEKVGNVTFGGARRDTLYIAASTSLYRIRLATRGVQRP